MSSPHENRLSHPLEQVTGEEDTPPEEERAASRQEEPDAGDDKHDAPGTADAATKDEPR